MARKQKVDYEAIVSYWLICSSAVRKISKAQVARQLGISVRTVERGLKWGIHRNMVSEEAFGPRPFKPKKVVVAPSLSVAWT